MSKSFNGCSQVHSSQVLWQLHSATAAERYEVCPLDPKIIRNLRFLLKYGLNDFCGSFTQAGEEAIDHITYLFNEL